MGTTEPKIIDPNKKQKKPAWSGYDSDEEKNESKHPSAIMTTADNTLGGDATNNNRHEYPTNPSRYGNPVHSQHGHRAPYSNGRYHYQHHQHPPGQQLPPRFQYHPPQFYVPREDPVQKKRRRCLYMYYVLRQVAIIITLIIIVLNINIYVSRRGRYLNDDTSAADPVYQTMWLTVPLSGVVAIWGLIGLICIRKSSHKGGVPYQVQFGVELLFALVAMVCFALLVVNMQAKQASEEEYEYPYLRYEMPLAGLLGLLMITQIGLVSRAWFEFNLERRQPGHDEVV